MTPALELIGVHKSFGATEVIRGVDLAIAEGERHAIIGPNGAGKSTLYNLITGSHAVSQGTIRMRGEDITGLRPFEVNRKGLSRSFQVTNIFHRMTVLENIRCGVLWSLGYKYSFWHFVARRRDINESAERVLEQIGLSAKRQMPAGMLSYTDQRALELGITIAGGAKVVLLDEPTAGMSPEERRITGELLKPMKARCSLLIVEHDLDFIKDMSDVITVLGQGQVLDHGTPEHIEASERVQEVYVTRV